MGQILISAAHKSSGKTIISSGICAALAARGLRVQPFKKGPDYIDPMWLSTAAKRDCYNLDFWTQSDAEIKALFKSKSADADFTLIEANKGLYDGLNVDGSNSNAALAKLLGSPVVLVLDCRGTIRGVAPLLLGYQQFDPQVNICGVILNFVGGARHEQKLREVIARYTNLPVLGAVQRNDEVFVEERYLGLIPSNEDTLANTRLQALAAVIEKQVDLDLLLKNAAAIEQDDSILPLSSQPIASRRLRVAYARDQAFGFYYADDLEAFAALGAELVPFDSLQDERLPAADALFIGGGFPERNAQQLEHNSALRQDIKQALENGMPAYAECGGLMYLCNAIVEKGQRREMVGLIDADCMMSDKPQGRGYTCFKDSAQQLWPSIATEVINAHEFHYSYLSGLGQDYAMSFDVTRGQGINGKQDGLRLHNTLACYVHQRHTEQNQWVSRFLDFAASCS
jgi:cobyrinic acid a,c-diamide synthase